MIRQVRLDARELGWGERIKLFALATFGVATGLAVVILTLGIAIFLLPVVAIALLAGAWWLGAFRSRPRATTEPDSGKKPPLIIETEYKVIDND